MAKVRITKKPKALSGLEVKMQDMKPGLYGTNGNRQFSLPNQIQSSRFSEPHTDVRSTLGPVDREDANLEAEKGETAVINVDGMPAHFKIGGNRHSEGGTPLSLPDNSFIYSDTAKMKIKDLIIQAQFGMVPKKSGYTPAEISKKYDINKFRKVLADKNSEPVERKTAEMMISNYNLKLAKLALIQESIKGFPQGIPLVAMPYIIENELDAAQFLPDQAQEQLEGAAQPDADTGEARYGANVVSQWDTHKYGGMPKAQEGYSTFKEAFDKMPKKAVKVTKPSIEDDFIGRGFDNDKVLEKKWADDSEVGPYYRLYKQAVKSGSGKEMRRVSQILKDADIPGFSYQKESGQNKLTDMAAILTEDADAIVKKYYVDKTPKPKTTEELDFENRQLTKEAYSKAYALKEKYKKENQPDSELYYKEKLEELYPLHPDYKKARSWRAAQEGQDERGLPGDEEYQAEKPTILYGEKDILKIRKLRKELGLSNPGEEDTKAIPEKKIAKTQTVEKPKVSVVTTNATAPIKDIEIKKKPVGVKKEESKNINTMVVNGETLEID
jgi:hypothetical protein